MLFLGKFVFVNTFPACMISDNLTTLNQRVEKRYFLAMLRYLFGFLLSIFVSTVLTWFIRNIATVRWMVRAPESQSHIHTGSIPRLGGVAVFSTFALLLGAVFSLFLLNTINVALIPGGAIMLMLLFFRLPKLNYHDFDEFERVGKRLSMQRTVCARNIAIRKAAFAIQKAKDSHEIAQLLQGCLAGDFDGFRIAVSDSFVRSNPLPAPWHGSTLSITWTESHDRIVYMLDLTAGTKQEIGTLSLFQSGNCDLLIDNELIKGELRRAVAFALQETIGIPHSALPTLPVTSDSPVLNPGLAL